MDCGLGTREADDPRRVPAPVRFELRPAFSHHETAVARIQALGCDPQDVRHIVFTHLDLDHASGLSDFPWATAHAMADERRHALSTRALPERLRYARRPLTGHTRWQLHGPGTGQLAELEGVRFLSAFDDEVALVPLPGHSRAHCGVAVRHGDGWLLHAGDSYLHRDELDTQAAPGLHQLVVEADRHARRATVERLRHVTRHHADTMQVFCSHDRREFERSTKAA